MKHFRDEWKENYSRLLGVQPQERDWGRAYMMLAEELSRVLEDHALSVETSAQRLESAMQTAGQASEKHAHGLVFATWALVLATGALVLVTILRP